MSRASRDGVATPVTVTVAKGKITCQLYTKELVYWDRATDWPRILALYDRHLQLHPGPTRQTGTHHQSQRQLGPGDQEREHDPRQGGVTDRVAEQTLATQVGEGAERPARCPEDRRTDGDQAQRIVAEKVH